MQSPSSASVHEVPAEDVAAATALRKRHLAILHWMGRAAALHTRPGIPPTGTPKSEWPIRTGLERRRLVLERSEVVRVRVCHATNAVPKVKSHSQSVRGSVGCSVGIKLAASARARISEEELEREANVDAIAEAVGIGIPALEDPSCQLCGKRRKLTFVDGVRSRLPCQCLITRRRRLAFK